MSAPEAADGRTGNAAGAGVTALAQHARRALAATGGGTLAIDGLDAERGAGSPGPAERELEVLLYEEDAEPRFLCEAGSAMAGAAARRRGALLDVSCCRRSGCRREVRFAGRLVLLDTDDVEGLVIHVVGLALSAISVRQPGIARVDVPMDRYRASVASTADGVVDDDFADGSESLTAYAECVVRHTDQSHSGALRSR